MGKRGLKSMQKCVADSSPTPHVRTPYFYRTNIAQQMPHIIIILYPATASV